MYCSVSTKKKKTRNYPLNIAKTIARERKRQTASVKNKQEVLKTKERERLQRWVELFSRVLNIDDATNPVEEGGIEGTEEIEKVD